MSARIIFLVMLFCLFAVPDSCRNKVDVKNDSSTIHESGAEQMELLEAHNKHRISKGLKPLEMDRKLCDYAERHAGFMSSKDRLSHSDMGDLQGFCGANVVGENIAWGQENVKDVVSDWIWSPGHRSNILSSSYSKVGFGVEKDSAGRKYWCVVFSS